MELDRMLRIALRVLALHCVLLAVACNTRCPTGMMHIPAGTFEMGTTFEEAYPYEKNVHKVTLSAFCMDRTEVTLDAYGACVADGRCKAGRGNGRYGCGKLPEHSGRAMNCVTWNETDQFCRQRGARLQTEAEWEYAARGSDGRLYPWGDAPPDRTRYYGGSDESGCPGCPTKVGSFPKGASPFGVLDMVGNVSEWVADYYGPYSTEPQVDPLQTAPEFPDSHDRVQRGGWGGFGRVDAEEKASRATRRHPAGERERHSTEGFRCAKSLE